MTFCIKNIYLQNHSYNIGAFWVFLHMHLKIKCRKDHKPLY